MPGSEPVQCAICGWTGGANDLEHAGDVAACPACGEEVR